MKLDSAPPEEIRIADMTSHSISSTHVSLSGENDVGAHSPIFAVRSEAVHGLGLSVPCSTAPYSSSAAGLKHNQRSKKQIRSQLNLFPNVRPSPGSYALHAK